MVDWERQRKNEFVFNKYSKPKLLRKGRQSVRKCYKYCFLPGFYKENLSCEPISEKTHYKYAKRLIDPDDKIAAQRGSRALRHETICNTAKFPRQGFGNRVEVDGYHEPIALLDPETFKPTRVRPIHYLAIETDLSIYVSWITDYQTGAEQSSYVVELYKRMLLPKPESQITYGTQNSNVMFYVKPYLIMHDGHKAFANNVTKEFIDLTNTASGCTKTQDAKGKPYVESANFSIKEDFTFTLPGHYDDTQDEYIDTKHFSKSAVLTTVEHEILFTRFIVDQYNYRVDKKSNVAIAEQWIRENAASPPAMPDMLDDIISFLGVKDKKTIQKAKGIQYQQGGKVHTFNSTALQKLRRVLLERHLELKVDFHRSEFFPNEIRVVNPIADQILVVKRIKEANDEILFRGKEEFYAELAKYQSLEYLSRLSDEQIINYAEARLNAIKKFKKENKLAAIEDAKSLNEIIVEDTKRLDAAITRLESAVVETQESEIAPIEAEDERNQAPVKASPTEVEDRPVDEEDSEDWDDSIDF